MSHILYGAAKPSIATSDEGWYPVAAQVGTHVNTRAARTDITSVIGAEAGHGAPACFVPSLAEMHLNTEVLSLGNPDKVDLHDALWCLEHAAAVGAMDHEAAHARHTRFDPRDLMENYEATRKMIDVITTLEEPRIEANALRTNPASLPFLRATAMEIVGRDFVIPDSRYGAAAAAGLLLARVDAKVLTKAEARTFRRDIESVLGTETLDTLEPLWQRFLRLRDLDFEGMVEVAAAWLDALGEDPEDEDEMVGESMIIVGSLPEKSDEDGEGEGEGSGAGGEGGDSEGEGGEGSGEGEGEGEGKDGEGEGDGKGKGCEGFGEKFKGKARRAEVRMDGEIVGKRGEERAKRRRAEREADTARKRESEAPHDEAFASHGVHGYTPDGFAHLTGKRPPSAEERRAARSLAKTLEQVEYRDRAVTKVTSAVPPGRLRGGAAVQDAAARSLGRDSDLPIWQGKRRKRVDSTPLTIGFAVDISGSMSSAMQPLASTQWVVTNAGAHIDAKVASVHFGDSVHGVTPVGVREREVRVFYPGDGSEAFHDAALAIDKELTLLDGTGARMLFIASDGCFVCGRDEDYARKFIPLAMRKGVAVIFLDFTGSMSYGTYGASVINCRGKSPAQVAQIVGKAAVNEMRRLDQRV